MSQERETAGMHSNYEKITLRAHGERRGGGVGGSALELRERVYAEEGTDLRGV